MVFVIAAVGFVGVIVGWFMLGYPQWNVWSQKKQGEADLEQAHMEQQIQIASARSGLEASKLQKQTAIIEAEAQAESIKIIGKGLQANPGYLQWQWIEMMNQREKGADVIYVPTEASLPIFEAGKRGKRRPR